MSEVAFEHLAPPNSFEKFRAKMRHFLRAHENHVAISKLRLNRKLTPTDIAELERMLTEEGGGTQADLDQARKQCHSLGLFVRSLIGLDRRRGQGGVFRPAGRPHPAGEPDRVPGYADQPPDGARRGRRRPPV